MHKLLFWGRTAICRINGTSLCPGTCCSSSGLGDEVGPLCLRICCNSSGLRDHFGLLCDLEHVATLTVCGTTWDLCAPEYFVALVVYGTT